MTHDQKEKAWQAKMTLARQLAGFYGVKIRIVGHRWMLSDGVTTWEYVAERTGQKLWSRR